MSRGGQTRLTLLPLPPSSVTFLKCFISLWSSPSAKQPGARDEMCWENDWFRPCMFLYSVIGKMHFLPVKIRKHKNKWWCYCLIHRATVNRNWNNTPAPWGGVITGIAFPLLQVRSSHTHNSQPSFTNDAGVSSVQSVSLLTFLQKPVSESPVGFCKNSVEFMKCIWILLCQSSLRGFWFRKCKNASSQRFWSFLKWTQI